MEGTVLVGFAQVIALSLAPVLVCAAALRLLPACQWMRAHLPGRRAPAPAPLPPLERIAADLRRLYPGVHAPVPGTRMAKQRGVILAYDDHLVAAARALGRSTALLELDVNGFDREAERLRVEITLLEDGLQLRP